MNKVKQRRVAEGIEREKHNRYISWADDIRTVESYVNTIASLVVNKHEAKSIEEVRGFDSMIESMKALVDDYIDSREWSDKYSYQEIVARVEQYEHMMEELF